MNLDTKTEHSRNQALDLFRAFALCMMASIHFMRGFINDYQGTWVGGLRYILESAPVFFFIAFGMTALHSVSGPRKWRRLLELGIISLLHQLYQKAFSPFQFDFFLFLWFMLLIIAIFRRLFLIRLFRLAILVGIITFNLLIGHGQVAIFGEHPFGPIPWAFCVIIGMMIGLETQTEKQRIRLAVIGAVLIVCAYAILWLAPDLGLKLNMTELSKWKPTTSTYLLLWSGIAMCVYGLFGYIRLKTKSIFTKFIRILSLFLLQGTVLHYFTNSALARIFHQGGYSTDVVFPWHMLIIAIAAVCLAIYVVITIMTDLRRIITAFVLNEKTLYLCGWVIAILILMIGLVFLFAGLSLSGLWAVSAIGMLIMAFVIIDTRKIDYLNVEK